MNGQMKRLKNCIRCRTLLLCSLMFTLHTRIALLTLLPLLLFASVRFVERQKEALMLSDPVHIGIEHAGNAAIALTRTKDTQPQLIDIANEGKTLIQISVPATWERGEVRGALLSSIIAEEPMFGYRRWHLPGGATLSFENPLPWTGMTVQNPSGLPLRLRTVTVNIDSGRVMREVYLVSKEPLVIE